MTTRTQQPSGYTVGAIAPSNPRPGDQWHELSPLGVSLYGWNWTWSAGRWVSPEQFWNISFNGFNGASLNYLDIDPRRIQILELRSRLLHSAAQTTSNRWNIDLSATLNNNVKVPLVLMSTEGSTTTAFNQRAVQSDTVLNFGESGTGNSDAFLEIFIRPSGSPGVIWGTVRLKYHFVR